MARGKRSVRPEFILGLVAVCLIVFTLILDWWEEHAVIGWTILVILIAVFVFLLYRFARFRGWIVRKGISAGKKMCMKMVFQVGSQYRDIYITK